MHPKTLYTPKYSTLYFWEDSEHYAKNYISNPSSTGFYLTKRQKKGILYWYVAEIIGSFCR